MRHSRMSICQLLAPTASVELEANIANILDAGVTNNDCLERPIILELHKKQQRRFEAGVINNDCLETLMTLEHYNKLQMTFDDRFYKFREYISRSGNGDLRETLLGV